MNPVRMWKDIGDWFGALLVTAALATSLFGVAEWVEQRSKPAVAAGAEQTVVAVDPGHGGFDGGAVGVTGVQEAGLNLAVAKLLAGKLEAAGVAVALTRETEDALASTKKRDLAARKALFNGPGVDLVVSIHMNKFTDPGVSGAMAYYMTGSTEGRKLAQQVIDSLCSATGRDRRLANPGDYFVIRECACPAVLVECGFLSNPEEERLLTDPAYQEILAEAVANGVLAYLSGGEAAGVDSPRPLLYNASITGVPGKRRAEKYPLNLLGHAIVGK